MNFIKYDGIYKAVVTSIDDPAGLGRVQIRIPEIDGPCSDDIGNSVNNSVIVLRTDDEKLTWAEVCRAFSSDSLPEVNQVVAVGFFGGDPDYPVILGWLGYDYQIEPTFTISG